jgi:REP element-mobilizing transposase RayT
VEFPKRQRLHHATPSWVSDTSLFFVTFCALPRGKNQLCVRGTAEALLESAALYHQSQRWWLQLFLLMPDHVHALMAVPIGQSLPDAVRMWKGYQAKQHGICWQAGFFDHRLRPGESRQQKTNYILMNPVRAGLVERAEDWPYVWPKNGSSGGLALPYE